MAYCVLCVDVDVAVPIAHDEDSAALMIEHLFEPRAMARLEVLDYLVAWFPLVGIDLSQLEATVLAYRVEEPKRSVCVQAHHSLRVRLEKGVLQG